MNRSLGSSQLTMVGGYIERRCKRSQCRRLFMCTSENVYRGYCSWSCMRKSEKEDGRKRKVHLADEAACLSRIAKCHGMIEHYKRIAETSESGTNDRAASLKSLRYWTVELEGAKKELERIEKEKHAQKRDS